MKVLRLNNHTGDVRLMRQCFSLFQHISMAHVYIASASKLHRLIFFCLHVDVNYEIGDMVKRFECASEQPRDVCHFTMIT